MEDLKKTLGMASGTILFVNLVVGAGVLAVPGMVYQQVEDSSVLAWLTGGGVAFVMVVLLTLLGRDYPDAGGILHYAQRAYGGVVYRVSAWFMLSSLALIAPAVALVGAEYLENLVPGPVPLYALAILLLITALHSAPARHLTRVLATVGSAAMLMLVLLILIGAAFLPHMDGVRGEILPQQFDWKIVMAPVMLVFAAFGGWEFCAGTSEEFINSRRHFPAAMMISFGIVMAFYIALAVVIQLAHVKGGFDAPFAEIMHRALGKPGVILVNVVAVVVIFANLFGVVWSGSRIAYSLGRSGVLPACFARVRQGIPLNILWTMAGAYACVIGLYTAHWISLETLIALDGQNLCLLNAVVAASLFVLTPKKGVKFFALGVVVLIAALVFCAGVDPVFPGVLMAFAVLTSAIGLRTKKITGSGVSGP